MATGQRLFTRERDATYNRPFLRLVRDLGMTATAVAERFRISQPAVSISVARGEAIVRARRLTLPEGANDII